MLKLHSEITLQGEQTWVFNALSSCVIVEDTENLTDTCVITLPKKITWEGNSAGTPIKRGDAITVKLGYTPPGMAPDACDLKIRFSGYVRTVDTRAPVKLECEDGMFLLKLETTQQRGFKNIMLSELIRILLAGTKFKFKLIGDDVNLGPYRITRPTVADELNELKRERNLMAYFCLDDNDESVLFVGYHYPMEGKHRESFVHSNNIIAEELTYRRSEDIKIKVKATSVNRKNVRSKIELPQNIGKDCQEISAFIYNADYDTLKLFAEATLR